MSSVVTDIPFKEKPDIATIFLRQLDRNNQAALISPEVHERSTRQTMSNLPSKWRMWVKNQDDKYVDYEPRWVFKTYGGQDIGSKENPALINESIPVRRLEDGSIDWGDPNIISPKLDTSPPPIDVTEFNDLVYEAAESADLTWTRDELEVDAGDTLEHVERKKTPLWWRKLKREQDREEAEEEALQDAEGEG